MADRTEYYPDAGTGDSFTALQDGYHALMALSSNVGAAYILVTPGRRSETNFVSQRRCVPLVWPVLPVAEYEEGSGLHGFMSPTGTGGTFQLASMEGRKRSWLVELYLNRGDTVDLVNGVLGLVTFEGQERPVVTPGLFA